MLDGRYSLVTESPVEARAILSEATIRALLSRLPRISLSVRAMDHPVGVDEIFCPLESTSADAERLRTLYELMTGLLRALVDEGEDRGDAVLSHIRRLRRPRHSVRARRPRRKRFSPSHDDAERAHAAQQLGLLGDTRAFEPLLRALDDPSKPVRLVVVRALGRLADRRAITALLPLLGDDIEDIQTLGGVARESLAELGAGPLVSAFDEAVNGDASRLVALAGAHRSAVAEALVRSLQKPRRRAFANAYKALADLNAVECLPILKAKLSQVMLPAMRRDCEGAIAQLEFLQALPRSAGGPADAPSTLPRSVGPDARDVSDLPRPSSADSDTTTESA